MPTEDAASPPIATAPAADVSPVTAVAPISQPTIPAATPEATPPSAIPALPDRIEAIKALHVGGSGLSSEHVALVTRMVDAIKAEVAKIEADIKALDKDA